jgi:hypothetical protein
MSGRGRGTMRLPQPSRERKRRSPPGRLLARFQNMTGQSTRLIAPTRWPIRCGRRANRTSSLEGKVRSSNRDCERDQRGVRIHVFCRRICRVEGLFKLGLAGNFFDDFALEEGLRRAVQKRLANQRDRTESSSKEHQGRTAFGNRIPGDSKEADVGD